MDDLLAFVRAQLDEDERVAREIATPEWSEGCSWLSDLRDPLPSQRRAYGLPKEWQLLSEADTRHIARWDPARVLAEVEAKRRVLDEFGWEAGETRAITYLAQPYAGRPGWREEWAV